MLILFLEVHFPHCDALNVEVEKAGNNIMLSTIYFYIIVGLIQQSKQSC